MAETIEVRFSKSKLRWSLAGSILLGLIGVAVGAMADPGRARVAGWTLVAISAVCLFVTVQALFRRDPVLIISEEGIQRPGDRAGFIAWSDVAAVGRWQNRVGFYLTLTIHDEKAPQARPSLWTRQFLNPHQRAGARVLAVPLWGLAEKPEMILEEVQRRHQRHGGVRDGL